MRVVLCTMLLAAALASAAFGDVRIEPKSVELYPTYSAVGLEVSYAGDDDQNSTASFVWRKAGEDTWRNGVDMTYDRSRRLIWASIWPLEQGDSIEVKVSFTEQDGETPRGDVTGSTTVRTLPTAPADARTLYVSADAAGAGDGSESAPFKTIAAAARAAKPGDVILVRTGVYHEGDLFAGIRGEAKAPIFVMAAPGAKPVLDGSAPVAKGSGAWRAADGVYAYTGALPDGAIGYVAQDGKRMFRYRSLPDLRANEHKVPRAWFFDEAAGTLYILPENGDANEHAFDLAYLDNGFLFKDSAHVVVKGFEIRNYGDFCVRFGDGAESCVVSECTIHNAPTGVGFRSETAHNNAVWNNDIYEEGLVDFSWNAIKASEYPRQAVSGISGRGTSVCYNRISGVFDGIALVTWQRPDRLDLNRDLDVMFNTVYNIGDDGLEMDGGGVNMRLHANHLRNCFAAISLAPVERGPLYCTYNDASYYVLMFKLNVGGCTSLGWTYCYHNSAYCLTKGDLYGGTAISFPTPDYIPISNKVFKNNAFICDGLGVRHGHDGYFIDYNCYGGVPGEGPVSFRWQRQDQPSGQWTLMEFDSIEAFAAETARERHGIAADPLFAATPRLGEVERVDFGPAPFTAYPQVTGASEGDFTLQPGSPCIDRGAVIRGINEGFRGSAPDIGAHEAK